MFFDSHAHLDNPRFDEDRDAVIAAMREAGVTNMINVGCDLATSRNSVRLAEENEGFYAAVGTHPSDSAGFTDETLAIYREMAAHEKVVAIGEIGLDYYRNHATPEVQKAVFRAQMELARELDMPVVIHDRDAHGDCLEMIAQFPEVTGVFHCYSGSWDYAQELLKRGWYLGFTGVITFSNARRALEVIENAPLHRMLIETDCPYLTPEPYRGRRNDPSRVPYMAAKIAEVRGITVEEAARITAENTKKLFRIA